MKHNFENNIKCPHCNWEELDPDNFELYPSSKDRGMHTCPECGNDFEVEVYTFTQYCTGRVSCEKYGKEHRFKYGHSYIDKYKVEDGCLITLDEKDWKYYNKE